MTKVIKKKILTEDDLLKFCQEQKFENFSSKDNGYQLALKVPTTFEIDNTVDENHRGMMKLKFRIFHTGLNRNKSFVSKEAAEKAMNTIADRPVLAAIHQLDDGTWDFEGHEIEVIVDEDGNEELRYIESQVGSFSSEPAFWEHDDELDKDYVCAYAYISEEYTRACDIIREKQGSKNSCELFIDELSYNAKEKYLELKDFYVNASTLLGSHDDGTQIQEGMQGARADIVDFSVNNNSVKFDKDERLIDLLENLNKTLSNLNIEQNTVQLFSREGGNGVTKFEELLKKYNKTSEDITFEYEGLTDEELEAKFEAEFGEDDADNNAGSVDGSEHEDEDNGEDDSDDDAENIVEYSYTIKGVEKKFSVSLQDKIYALYDLVNATYGETDNTYYSVIVYDDYVIMQDYWNNKNYKQTYTSDNDVYTLTGDRIEVYTDFVTKEEQEKLEEMRSNYSALKEFKETVEKNELNEKKNAILSDEKYAAISQKDEEGKYINAKFAELVESIEDYSLEDLETKVKVIHSDFISENSTFSSIENNDTKAKKKSFSNPNSKKVGSGRYGNLFSK